MTDLSCFHMALQAYWWVIIAVLGAALVFLLFVQGGQSMLLNRLNADDRTIMINILGRKWELTFTTLVVFGGAFFASFPLFYSTSFGGAYWLWMLILFSFVLQAVSYEFRSKKGNIFGTRTYDTFLFINGCAGCFLLGVAVSMMFFGAAFTVTMGNILDPGAPVISTWVPTHGIEAICDWRNWILGLTVFFLARTLAALFFINQTKDAPTLTAFSRRQVVINGAIFVIFFLTFAAMLLTAPGQQSSPEGGFEWVEYKYLSNLLHMWWVLVLFLIGVIAVLYGIGRTVIDPKWRHGIWPAGVGTVLVVLCLFFLAGFNDTAYYPSLIDTSSSLSIRNSSSTEFTLTVMSWVSILVPFVVAYIAYVWVKMTKPVSPQEMASTHEKY